MRRRWVGVALVGLPVGLYAISGCSDDPKSDAPTTATRSVSKVVGATGGMVATDDGRAQLDIPPGALPADTTITISANTSAPMPAGATVVGTPFTFQPDGLKFLKPITVTLAFDATKLPAETTANAIVVYTAPDGSSVYEPLSTSVKDATHVVATTTHFSTDVPGIGGGSSSGKDGGDSTSPVCAQGGAHCGSTSGPGCGASTPTCQSSNLCASYPGSTVQSCTADPSGADATCCFPAGTPTCFHAGAGCGGAGCNPPKCATANPCGTYPGATMQSCTDVSGGYDAVCCLPAGTPLPGGTIVGGQNDGGTGGTPGTDGGSACSLACHGSSSGTCGCQTTCNGHDYVMTCNGSTCDCTTDTGSTGSFAQSGTCGGSQTVQQAFVSGCGYPANITGGGDTDAGSGSADASAPDGGGGSGGTDGGSSGGCSPVTCGGSGGGCNCNETCNGHNYQLVCTTGASCTCYVDGTPGASSATGTTCSNPADVQSLFQSQCAPGDAGSGG